MLIPSVPLTVLELPHVYSKGTIRMEEIMYPNVLRNSHTVIGWSCALKLKYWLKKVIFSWAKRLTPSV